MPLTAWRWLWPGASWLTVTTSDFNLNSPSPMAGAKGSVTIVASLRSVMRKQLMPYQVISM